MFGHVDLLSAARLLPSPVRCWARVCCKVLCGECELWHDSQALYDFVYLVVCNFWMQSEGKARVLSRLDNEFQTAYHYEEDEGEEDSEGSERIELDADSYWDLFIIGEKEQLECWYLKNSGPHLQLYYTNEDYYQDKLEEEEAEADVDAEEEEAEADVDAEEEEAEGDVDAEEEEAEAEAEADVDAEEEEAEAYEGDYQQQVKGILPVNYSVAPVWTWSLSSGAHEHSQEEGPRDTFAQGAHGTGTTAQWEKANTPTSTRKHLGAVMARLVNICS